MKRIVIALALLFGAFQAVRIQLELERRFGRIWLARRRPRPERSTSTGQHVGRVLKVDAACTQVTDNFGNVVYTTTGGSDAVCTTLSGDVTRSNSLLSSCAASAKCNL